jgi:hypothetical protein
MSKQKLVDCKCGGKAEAIQDGPMGLSQRSS